MSHHIFALCPVTTIWSLRRAENDLNAVFLFYMFFLNAGEFAENWPSHTQRLIYSELLTILTVKIMGFIDLHKSFINGSVSVKVTMGEAGLWKKLRKWKYISEFNRSSELHDCINSKDKQKPGSRYFTSVHSQFQFLFIIYSFLLPEAKHADLKYL